jgi:3',5'-cyclic AMP phosphodiesterase CpdA
MIRLAHLSDIHVTADRLEWTRADWFNKRYAAWVNFRWLGRRRRFRHGNEALTALMAELRERRPDHIVFSGDATALGFEAELARAANILGVDSATSADSLPGLAVPGNHDYCTRPAAASGLFERYFAPWQGGQRVDGAVYPFAQKVGHAWLVAVNSCTGNRWAWDAAGSVGPDQLDRLGHLLDSLSEGPRILVTHYPVRLANGRPERSYRCLRDLDALLAGAVRGKVCLWLHGHRHHPYLVLPSPENSSAPPFPVLCAGSATETGCWSYGDYTLEGYSLHVQQRVFDLQSRRLVDGPAFDLSLE